MELNPILLLEAYSQGFFPMADDETGEIRWYRPDPRAIIPLDKFHRSSSLKRVIKKNRFKITFDTAFEQVMRACADREETWISEEFITVYGELHAQGHAHCVEAWLDSTLVGGAYGVTIGGAFFAESMFHKKTDASKVALSALVDRLNEKGFDLLEVQFLTPHLQSLGARVIPDVNYISTLNKAIRRKVNF